VTGLIRRHLRELAAAIAIVAADVVWLIYASQALGRGGSIAPADGPWFVGIVGVGLVLDLVVARLSWASPARRGFVLGYLGLRTFLSAVGFLFLTLPFYLVAFGAIALARPSHAMDDPDQPHPFVPQSRGWFRALTPVSWSQNLLGASQYGARGCGVCGRAETDPIHADAGSS